MAMRNLFNKYQCKHCGAWITKGDMHYCGVCTPPMTHDPALGEPKWVHPARDTSKVDKVIYFPARIRYASGSLDRCSPKCKYLKQQLEPWCNLVQSYLSGGNDPIRHELCKECDE